MANSVEAFELDTTFKYPKLYDNEEEVFNYVIRQKYKDKLAKGIITYNPQYKENIQEELRVFKKLNMIGFMLFMSELISWCKENGIPVGNCRGSVGGSTIAYITDIIDLDPVVWNTVFSRFCNEDRLEIGDIDVDISPTQRELVYNHIID
jgi:DNA polymerase-3 subunit alpha